MKKREAHILTLTVDNEFGVLTRISSQIRREGWNIKSLAAQETLDPSISRITLALECFDATLPNVVARLAKLACVREVTAFDPGRSLCRELALVRLQKSEEALAVLNAYRAQVLAEENGLLLAQLVDEPRKLNEFLAAVQGCGGLAEARSGAITLEKA